MSNRVIAAEDVVVDLVREECELEKAAVQSQRYISLAGGCEYLCLIDGGLTFWYVANKPEEVQRYFLSRYINLLSLFYQKGIYVAGYLSLPKNCELASLIKARVCMSPDKKLFPCNGSIAHCPCVKIQHITDLDVVSWFLSSGSRTVLFANRGSIVTRYPIELRPYFFYLHTGEEIVRIEVPFWITNLPGAVDIISAICLDQARKGLGYPVVLAEAHEQAVVRACDREFFLDLIHNVGIECKKKIIYSQKSIKKRMLNI